MTANVPGYFGSDHTDRRFKLSDKTKIEGGNWLGKNADEKYFTLVKKEDPGKGTILVYNEEVGQDRLVGWKKPGEEKVTAYNGDSRTKVEIVNGKRVYTQVSTSEPPQDLPAGLVNPDSGYSVAGNIKSGARKFESKALQEGGQATTDQITMAALQTSQKDLIDGVNGSDKTTVPKAVLETGELLDTNMQTNVDGGLVERQKAITEAVNLEAIKDDPGVAGTNNDFGTGTGYGQGLKYPLNLQELQQDIIKFDVLKYAPDEFKTDATGLGGFKGAGRGGGDGWAGRESIGTVFLPIPGGIEETNAVDWGDSAMNPVEAAAANVALSALTDGRNVGKSISDIAAGVKANKEAIKGGLAALLTEVAVGTEGGSILSRTTGAILNPNMALLFKKPVLRPFAFSFKLAPRSRKEALEVMKIIRLFKQAMAPIRSENMLFLKSPHTFRLKYMHKHETHPYLNSFKECALMSMTVNYTPEQSYSTYDDGVMTAYTMTLQFKELEAVFNDDYGSAKGRTNLNFAVDGESTKFESSSWDPESGISPGYGTEADDPERISPITGKKQDLSKGGAYI